MILCLTALAAIALAATLTPGAAWAAEEQVVIGMDVTRQEIRTSLERVKGKLSQGATVESEADLVEAYQGVGHLVIDLPLQATEVRLTAARVALAQRDTGNANAALADAINHTDTWTATAETTEVEADVAD